MFYANRKRRQVAALHIWDKVVMKILWLHQHFATPKGWGSTRPYEFTRRIAAAGHEIDVVCCAGFDDTLQNGAEIAPGVRVFVGGAAYHTKMSALKKMFSFLRFMFFATCFAVRHAKKYDVVVASSTPLTIAVSALAAHWLRNARYIFEVRDVWPDAAIEAGVLKNPLLKTLAFWLEKRAYKNAAAIVTCSTGMTERVEAKLKKWKLTRRVETISNCCYLEMFPWPKVGRGVSSAPSVQAPGAEGTPRPTFVLYTGAMGISNAVEDLVAAAKATASDANIVWWFAGDGVFAKDLKALAETQANVVFWGAMPKAEVAKLYAAADVNVVSFARAPVFYENSPNKFFDGIAAGLPAVFNRTTWLEPWLREYDCGFVCDTPEKIAGTLRNIAAMPEHQRGEMSRRARKLAEDVFNCDALARQYLDVVSSSVAIVR